MKPWSTCECYFVHLFIKKRCKCTFSSYILLFFHFGLYILFLPLLVPKLINAWHLSPHCQPTNRNAKVANVGIKILLKKLFGIF